MDGESVIETFEEAYRKVIGGLPEYLHPKSAKHGIHSYTTHLACNLLHIDRTWPSMNLKPSHSSHFVVLFIVHKKYGPKYYSQVLCSEVSEWCSGGGALAEQSLQTQDIQGRQTFAEREGFPEA